MNLHFEICGFYKIEAHTVDENGDVVSTRVLADWFPNLITNIGMDFMGTTTGFMNWCRVGSGNTVPAFTDTALVSQVASTNNIQSTTRTAGVTPDWFAKQVNVYRFGVGVAAGNLSEVGIGWASTGSTLFSRALIVDGGGLPTTITVLPSEILDVSYEFRTYPPLTDTVGSVTISSINYNYTARASNVNQIKSSVGSIGWGMANVPGGVPAGDVSGSFAQSTSNPYTGTLGPITGQPSGQGLTFNSVAPAAAYVAGTFTRDFTLSAGVGDLNVSGGMKCLSIGYSWFNFQIEFTPVIPKDATKVFSMTFRHSWARH